MLPYGYSVSLVLAFTPSVWFKVINPMARAANNNEKITKEEEKEIERLVKQTLLISSVVITFITFYLIGF